MSAPDHNVAQTRSVEHVAQVIGNELFRRALAVERDATIIPLNGRWPGHESAAQVRLSKDNQTYFATWQVNFDRRQEQLLHFFSYCECGNTPCEHAVAAWLRDLFAKDLELAQRWRAYGDPQQLGLTHATSRWLATLTPPTALAKQPAPSSEVLILYILKPEHNLHHIDRIDTVRVKRLVKGGFAKNATAFTAWSSVLPMQHAYPSFSYSRYGGYADLNYIDDTDRAVAKFLFLQDALPLQGAIRFQQRDFSAILTTLATSGRLTFWDHQGTPLSLGQPRRGELGWQAQPDNHWRLAIQTTPPASWMITSNPPWYVDLEAQCIGPIETHQSAAVLNAVITAPPVTSDELGPLTVALSRHGDIGAALPSPPLLTTEDRGIVRPTPVLELTTMAEHHTYGSPAVVPVARIGYLYNGKRYGPDGADLLMHTEDNTLIVQQRDRVFEQDCLRQLEQFHLLPAGDGDDVLLFEDPALADPLLRCLDFQNRGLNVLRQDGWEIQFAAKFPFKLAHTGDWEVSLEDAEPGWFDASLGVEIDGKRLNLVPLLRAMLADDGRFRAAIQQGLGDTVWYYPLSHDTWIPIPAERVRRLAQLLLELEHQSSRGRLRVSRFELAALEDGNAEAGIQLRGGAQIQALASALNREPTEPPAQLPDSLRTQLRPYQRTGVAFLQGRMKHAMGVVLADDMGLGKTVQVLTHILADVISGNAGGKPSLIVVPRTLLSKWSDEQRRFTPQLTLLILHGTQRAGRYERIGAANVVVTTYELLVRDAEVLQAIDWHIVALDEGHRIRNPKAQQSQIAYGLQAAQRVVVSGTPLQNRLEDLWSVFNFAVPGLLRGLPWFKQTFGRGADSAQSAVRLLYQQRLARLGALISPFYLRRTKAEVQHELPPRTEVVRSIRIDGAQRDLYETVRARLDKSVRDEINKKGIAGAHIMILAAITQLRQVCCDPALLKLDGATNYPSAKLQELEEVVRELLDEGHRPIIYSSFAEMLARIGARLTELGISFSQITGQTRDRETPQQRFKSGKVNVLLLSLKAAGEGIDLPEADSVILYDPWWNPFAEEQAIARAHRSGQKRNVLIMRLVVEGSLEEGVIALAEKKRNLVDAIFKGADDGLQKLTLDDIDQLLAPMR